ncbi:MAG TPA: LPS export ABC transporter periplasmic protein LptC [Abditibacterium sp.]|jgi:hypothetical protein
MSLPNSPRGVAPLFGLGAAPRARLRRWLGLAVGVGASVWLWQWVSTDDKGDPIAQKTDDPSLQIENLRSFLVRRDGLPLWEISAGRVAISADGNSTEALNVRRGTLFRAGKPFLQLSAPRVRLSKLSNNLEATGGVRATGPDGFSFQTARALWVQQTQMVHCPRPVEAQLKGLFFSTKRLSYNWKQEILACPTPVEVRAKGAVFRGANLEVDIKARRLKQTGGVEMIFAPRVLPISLPR